MIVFSQAASDRDTIFRFCTDPQVFHPKRGFEKRKVVHLTSEDNSLVMSVAWERYAPTVGLVNAYGCRFAANMNLRPQNQGKSPKVYCGSYAMRVRDIRAAIEGASREIPEIVEVRFEHFVEADEIAHMNLRFQIDPTVDGGSDTATAIFHRLWNLMSGPVRHVCDCDGHLGEKHRSLQLVDAALGEYVDRKTPMLRRWYMTRFYVYRWYWGKFKSAPAEAV